MYWGFTAPSKNLNLANSRIKLPRMEHLKQLSFASSHWRCHIDGGASTVTDIYNEPSLRARQAAVCNSPYQRNAMCDEATLWLLNTLPYPFRPKIELLSPLCNSHQSHHPPNVRTPPSWDANALSRWFKTFSAHHKMCRAVSFSTPYMTLCSGLLNINVNN